MTSTPLPPHDRARRKHVIRRAIVPITALIFSVTLGACAGGRTSPGVASVGTTTSTTAAGTQGGSTASNYADAVAYAQCMRTQGVGNWPDPQSSGGFLVQGSGSANPSHSPEYHSANQACMHLLPNGGQPTAGQSALTAAAALKYAKCMRAHGVLDFPDPSPGGGINLGGNESIDHNTPQFSAALKTCEKGLPGGGPPSGP